MPPRPGAPGRRWLLLISQLPSKPDYFRVKIWRRLQRIGAVAIKSSVYALPQSEQAVEHFQWMVREIGAAGGEASVCDAAFVDGLSDGQIEGLFRAARGNEYAAVADEADELLRELPAGRRLDSQRRAEVESAASRLRRRMGEIAAIDYFGAPSRRLAEATLQRLEGRVRPAPRRRSRPAASAARARNSGRIWVTRQGVYVDRIASAWLIRRFIDSRARFRFVEERSHRPGAREVRFDMFEAEYTHEGDQCTFEVLLAQFGLDDPGLRALAEMVHDIDLRDAKFGRPETAGLGRMIDGITRKHSSDDERLSHGAAVLDSLFASLQGDSAGKVPDPE
ncbi:MAG: chromate resistance protein ChrB domain-containing protein [Gemmatimonadales bacterium]